MRYDFSMEMDDLGRMEARVLGLFERLQAAPLKFCSLRLADRVVVHGILEIDENHAPRIEALCLKLEGVRSISCCARDTSASAP
jgi:hypothetical protein